MNTLDNNKLISEFMGLKPNPYNQDPLHPTDFAEDGDKCIKYSAMEFHTSWKWLMPVVEEMHTYGCEVVISSNGVTTIYAPSGEVLAEESSKEDDHMRDATYKAIVKVLKENLHKTCE